jgi:hypothetical protein
MTYHKPYSNAIPNVISPFKNAPFPLICNPDGIAGINLHIQLDEEIPHQNLVVIDDTRSGFDTIKNDHFGAVEQRASDLFLE